MLLPLLVILAFVAVGCSGGSEEETGSGAPAAESAGSSPEGGSAPPDGGSPSPSPEMGMGDPAMGGDPEGSSEGAAPAAPTGAAAELAKVKTMADLGEQYLKLEAYDLAIAAFREAISQEPENRGRAKRGLTRATALYKKSLAYLPPPPPPPSANQGMGEGMGGPGMLPAPPPGSAPPMPGPGAMGSGYQMSGPMPVGSGISGVAM